MDNFYSYHNHKLSNRNSVAQAYHSRGDSTAASLQQQLYASPSPGVNLYNNAYNSYNSSQRNDGEVELQKRLSKARALNLLYKQQVAKNVLSNNSIYGSSDMRGHEVGGIKPKMDERVDHQHLLLSEVEHTEAASSINHRNHDARDIVDDKDGDKHHDHSIQTSSNPGRHPLNNSSDDDHHVDGVVRSNQTRNNGHDQQQPVSMTPHDNIINSSRGRHETSRSNTHDDTTNDIGDHKNRFRPYDHDSTSRRRNMNNQSSTTTSSTIRTGNSDSGIGSKKSLQEATDRLKAAIEEHSIYLNKQVYERQEKEQKKKIERQRIDRILSSEVIHGKMPLWRHVLEGRHHPSKDTILRGVRLWRAITRVLIQIVYRPCLLILKNKLRIKAREMRDYTETLNIIAGSMDEWLSKLVQLPIASIVQEKGFQFDPEEVAFNAQPLRIRMLQLKVRFRAILLNIASSDMPSETITSFLLTLIEDGSYYGDILWPFEEKQLAFDSLSATRHMIIEVHHDDGDDHIVNNSSDLVGDDGDDVRDKNDDDGHSSPIDPSDLIELRLVDPTVTDTRTINIRRVRLILQDFIFIRVLINHLILSPWNYNICPKPKNRHTKRAITNYRIMASVVYEFLRSMDGSVPPIIQKVIPSKHNSFIHGSVSNVVSDADNGKNKSDGGMTMNAGIISSIESNTKAGEGVARPTGFMYRLSSLLGMSDTTPGEQVWSSDSIEMQLLGIRPTYTSLRHIHNRMYPPQALLPVKNLLSSWFSEVIAPVKEYMNRLIVHVLKLKHTKMKKDEGMKEQLIGNGRNRIP